MTTDNDAARVATYEHLIRQVRGVQGVRVVCSDDQIDEIHVLGSPDRSPKAIIRDIETILMIQGGVRINHRKISLAQVADTVVPQVRVQLYSVESHVEDGHAHVTIALNIGRRRVEGSASAAFSNDDTLDMLVGQAMVNALTQLLDAEVNLQVMHVKRERLGVIEVCMAHIELQTEGRFETMLGISAVRSEPLQAMARALLDAMNRRLPGLMTITAA